MLGPNAALPALIIGSAPFYGRLVEIAFREIDKGVIEASLSMGASIGTIIKKVLIPESYLAYCFCDSMDWGHLFSLPR